MSKNIVLVIVLLILSSVYVVYFTDLFNKPTISISARPRAARSADSSGTVSFSFDRRCELTEIKVVNVAELETNKYARAYWHLISDSSSDPLKGIMYGENVKGMKPKIPKMKPEPLQAGQKYRLFLLAGKSKGEVDFEMPPKQMGR